MANIKAVKEKIIAIEQIKKITNAMQIVALTRLRKMEHETLDARPYFDKIRDLLFDISKTTNFNMHTLLSERPSEEPCAIIVLGSDKGLCGNFNANIINTITSFKAERPGATIKTIAAGKKIIQYLKSKEEFDLIHTYAPIDYKTLYEAVEVMSNLIIDEFKNNKINSLFLVYNEFKKHILGEAKVIRLLPLALNAPLELEHHRNYTYEPEPVAIFDDLLKEYITNQIHQAALESRTAEEMARMLAMKAATDNANKTIKKLTLAYHKARQATITNELIDIIGAAGGIS